MNAKKNVRILQYVLLLSAGIYLGFLFFRDFDFSQLQRSLLEANTNWFYVVLLVSLAVYVLRVLRWQLLIEAAGHKASFLDALAGLSIGYFVNFAVPRLGEVTRCLSVKKNSSISFLSLLGTVIIERVVDILSLLIFLGITLLLQFDHILDFVRINVWQPLYRLFSQKISVHFLLLMLVGGMGMLLLLFLWKNWRKKNEHRLPSWLSKFLQSFREGLISIGRLKKRSLFFLYTLLIWAGYFFMTYFWFFVFPESSGLGWGACLSIVAIGTIGRSIPIQGGGMGAYHFLVTNVVVVYGLSEQFGKTLATMIHAGQTFFTFLMGIVGLLIFFVRFWQQRGQTPS